MLKFGIEVFVVLKHLHKNILFKTLKTSLNSYLKQVIISRNKKQINCIIPTLWDSENSVLAKPNE